MILGISDIYNGSLKLAFKKRKWDLNEIEKYKKKFAINLSLLLVEHSFSKEEKEKIKTLLTNFGNSFELRLRFTIYDLKLGIFFLIRKKILINLKNKTKNLLMSDSSSTET